MLLLLEKLLPDPFATPRCHTPPPPEPESPPETVRNIPSEGRVEEGGVEEEGVEVVRYRIGE